MTGPAGIGKSYFIKNKFLNNPKIQARYLQVTKDGSNDEFLTSTVGDVLQRDVTLRLQQAQRGSERGGKRRDRVLLVLDEYHMMPYELKRQLLAWAFNNQRKAVLLMISNRLDQHDLTLFDMSNNDALAPSAQPKVRVIRARGSVYKILGSVVYPQIRARKPVRYESAVDVLRLADNCPLCAFGLRMRKTLQPPRSGSRSRLTSTTLRRLTPSCSLLSTCGSAAPRSCLGLT